MNTLILSLLIACGDKTSDTGTTNGGGDDTADLANGESIYSNTCMACHAGNGFDILALSSSLDDAQLESVIVDGIGGMPSQSSLSDADVTDVIAYIRSQE